VPIYQYRCSDCGAVAEKYSAVADRNRDIPDCHGPMTRQLCAPMVSVQADMHALSPIDGTPLTSRRQRTEYMKRNGLQEALPGHEMIRNAKAKRQANETLAAKLPKLAEPIRQQISREAGLPG